MERVFFAHNKPCTSGVPHAENIVAHMRQEVGLEVVTWLNHDGVTPESVATFLDQFRQSSEGSVCTKGTLVVVDAVALPSPMEVLAVIHHHLPTTPLHIRFLVLMPLLPTACVFCPCHSDFE